MLCNWQNKKVWGFLEVEESKGVLGAFREPTQNRNGKRTIYFCIDNNLERTDQREKLQEALANTTDMDDIKS